MPKKHRLEALMRYAKILKFGHIHHHIDTETGIQSIIAIHNTQRGPAIGGCRCYEYTSTTQAIKDVLRLSYMMTLKAAMSDLPHGGAKSVIIKPKNHFDRERYFKTFGDFVHKMNGDYIVACDVGTTTNDMDTISGRTPYVIGATTGNRHDSDPAPHTARGVYQSILAALQHKYHSTELSGRHITIQGAGNVGYQLAQQLTQAGAKVSMSDPDPQHLDQCADELGIIPVDIDAIYDIPADIFSPCALGGILNANTISRLKTPIIAGSANNQLAHKNHIQLIQEKGILYAPDFVANAGGLINAAMVYDFQDPTLADKKIDQLYSTLLELFDRAKKSHTSTVDIAETIAIEKLNQASTTSAERCSESH